MYNSIREWLAKDGGAKVFGLPTNSLLLACFLARYGYLICSLATRKKAIVGLIIDCNLAALHGIDV